MKINLREIYPFYYQRDEIVEVDDAVIEQFKSWKRSEESHRRKLMRHRAYYVLELDSCVQQQIDLSPEDIYIQKEIKERIRTAVTKLPEKQVRRIYAYYFLGISKTKIAEVEKVTKGAITISIEKGIQEIREKIQKEFQNS